MSLTVTGGRQQHQDDAQLCHGHRRNHLRYLTAHRDVDTCRERQRKQHHQPHLEGIDGQRRRDGLPDRALPERRLHGVCANRDVDRNSVQQHGPRRGNQLQVPRKGHRRGGRSQRVLEHSNGHHRVDRGFDCRSLLPGDPRLVRRMRAARPSGTARSPACKRLA